MSIAPASSIEPAVGASLCASGSQVWKGQTGTLMAKATKKPMKAKALTVSSGMPRKVAPTVLASVGQVCVSVTMSKLGAPSSAETAQPTSCVASRKPSEPPSE